MMYDRSTIYALSTGLPPSGIAIIRVSGPAAEMALLSLTGKVPAPRLATRVIFRSRDGISIDDGLAIWFPGPQSATGEDISEFHVHGGRAIIAALLAEFGRHDGMRPAEPGEFTLRAFENGKLDLVAAEALDDLIHADTEQQRRQSLRQLKGLLGDRARDWRQRIVDASALIEAGIDFSDEGDVGGDLLSAARESVGALRNEIAGVLADSGRSERLRDSLVVTIVGAPNVGKSTLLNTLAQREAAIVSPYAGTTRDALEVHLDLGGFPVTLVDTAGLRETGDPVEQEGIRRAQSRAIDADLVLWLDDTGFPGPPPATGSDVLRVGTKSDLLGASGDFAVSARSGAGIADLVQAMTRFADSYFKTHTGLITRARHRHLLIDAEAGLARALAESEPELIAEGLRNASTALGRLLGQVDVEDILESIFSRFCIGK